MSEETEGVDFAVAAFREDGVWTVAELAHDLLEDIEGVSHALRRFPGESGAVGLIGMDEDFFLMVRVTGATTRVLLSDIAAADEWELAASALEHLGLPLPDGVDDEDDEPEPAGDLGMLSELGMTAIDMGELLDDDELYPDELLSEVARELGFGDLFDDVVGLASA